MQSILERFPISSDDCYLLLALDSLGSVKAVSNVLKRDVSVVSRQISKLASNTGLIEKIGGKWQVSTIGKELNHWTRDAIIHQSKILKYSMSLKIGTTREFAARVLAPHLSEFVENHPNVKIQLISLENGIEDKLIHGTVDLGIDCGRPQNPAIRFKRIAKESFTLVCSPRFQSRWKIQSLEDLLQAPHLQYLRLHTADVLMLSKSFPMKTVAQFNDIGAIRSSCIAHLGWALLPYYTVAEEIEKKLLVELLPNQIPLEQDFFSIWWMRERPSVNPWIQHILGWLQRQNTFLSGLNGATR